MTQLADVCDAEARLVVRTQRPERCHCHRQIGIGEGEDNEIRRRQPEILRAAGGLIKITGLADNDMHFRRPSAFV